MNLKKKICDLLPYKCWKTVIKHFLIIKSFETGTFAESHSTTSWTSGEGSGPRSSQGNPESDQNQKPGMDSNNKCYKVVYNMLLKLVISRQIIHLK